MDDNKFKLPASISRRRFVQGLAVGGVIASFPHVVRAGSSFKDNAATGSAPELSGKSYRANYC